ncbi:DUF559 domain-containing protein [Solwaraspora sp. WMMD1047]|uniref:endonuclease domain-containing protein n=1 Tax=Solwaraspora sp. WMMD1047 TaxID=3016102 RepID=UPI002417C478|nr:DUF559 domain-containing protein [Solwaraspora sp. WMMD1047]MDG4830901.1 DUF559 domain-containing protein [Solwaraspora sp. WMMD1047]
MPQLDRLWADLPIGRVCRLTGASPAALGITLSPLPRSAPATVTFRPRSIGSQVDTVETILRELERVALDCFPAWLPAATGIPGPGGAGVAAVRTLARRLAPTVGQGGPFLADLAERSLRATGAPGGQATAPAGGRYSTEVRAAGLARVIAASFGRPTAGLLVQVPTGLTAADELSLVAAGEWLAHRGDLGVWLVGAPLRAVDWLPVIEVRVPDQVARLERDLPRSATEPVLPTVYYPPLAGRPHPASSAERALESALARQPWATGRAWNQTYQSRTLVNPVRLDLVWPGERCAVEIDGAEHREPLRFAADRRRDVGLQLDGYAVLRFTNDQVRDDLAVVIAQIGRFISQARRGRRPEGNP